MRSREGDRKRKRHDDADTDRALQAASGSSFRRGGRAKCICVWPSVRTLWSGKKIGHTGRGWTAKYWEAAQEGAQERLQRCGSGACALDKAMPRGGGSTSGEIIAINNRSRRSISDCLKLAKKSSDTSATVAKAYKKARTSVKLGRPFKAPTLRENLFYWLGFAC